MKKSRKIVGVALVLALALGALIPAAAFAAETGEVACTVSGKLIALTVTDASVDFGTLDLGSTKNSAVYNAPNNTNGLTPAQTQTITNTGTVAEDFNMKTSNASGGTNWTIAAAAGSEEFTYAYLVSDTAYAGGAAIGSFTKWAAADSYVADAGGANVAASGVKYLELEIGMPTLTADYGVHTITVTVLAVEAGA
ncbi:MAG: hypothetical protein KAW00_05145 [Dehalococcoidia bacterium]|nr:hypothetical protein [Dehalococcoidia bacterium]